MKLVLVTGVAGYIGTVVAERLLTNGYRVIGTDTLRFGSKSLLQLLRYPNFEFILANLTRDDDLRNVFERERPGCIVHLAAIVGDPACKAEPELACQLNVVATKSIFSRASDLGVHRFIFVSTCSNYGLSSSDTLLTEVAALNPLSLYSQTKVEVEEWLHAQAEGAAKRIVLRFATAHGLSHRMRFDLTVNEFTKQIAEGRTLDVYDADTWRPYCHVRDFAAVIHAFVERTSDEPSQIFNVGFDSENFRKRDLIEKISFELKVQPSVRYVGDGVDRRNYRVSFESLRQALGLEPTGTVSSAIREIASAVKHGVFLPGEMRYGNV